HGPAGEGRHRCRRLANAAERTGSSRRCAEGARTVSQVDPRELPEDEQLDLTLRPKTLGDYIGQDGIKENLSILLEAARRRGEAVDHVLFSGPPGLGKTTLANIVANELGVSIRTTSGPAIDHAGALASMLLNLAERDVFFIDEIHRLNKIVEESL